jgi:protein phosphatase PTC7
MASYLVKILTHARRGAGTTASVRIFRLTGHLATAGPFEWMRDGFPSGSTVTTRLRTDKPLGVLKELEIGHDSIGDVGTGWLLSGVTVIDESKEADTPSSKEAYFPCGRWLGESDVQGDISGPAQVVLYNANIVNRDSGDTQKSRIPRVPIKTCVTSAFAIPEVTKLKQGKRARVAKLDGYAGEDAYFISKDACLFGVSDGVSQWSDEGVDAGLFARALLEGAALSSGSMDAAFKNAQQKKVQGSATLALVKIDKEKSKCIVESVGDSRVVLVRNGHCVEQTIEQEHSFGVPFQLSSNEGRDEPKDALKYEWNIQSRDIIVCGSDGLFDNISEEHVAKIVWKEEHKTAFEKAIALCQAAFVISAQKNGETPYSKAANEALNLAFSGGKSDDITAIVCLVD